MADVFVEQIIKRKLSLGGLAIRIGAIFLVLIGILLLPVLKLILTITELIENYIFIC